MIERPLLFAVKCVVYTLTLLLFIYLAYDVRLDAIHQYGTVIHEFDPYFHFRATEYLYNNGWKAFMTWFDYKSWYPLGRPIGTTIYPGMMVTAVFIKNYIAPSMSLNDICCYIPAWFGAIASVITGLLAYECCGISNNSSKPNNKAGAGPEVFIATVGIMGMVPAHLMRSIAGGYDNESIAVAAMVLCFYLWVRSLRVSKHGYDWLVGILTGLAYFNMAAAWGGYIFVLNMIGMHAGVLVLTGKFNTQVYRAYSLFYFIGTALAMQVPVVGKAPLKSLEQLGPCAVFLGYQVLELAEYLIRKKRIHKTTFSRKEAWALRVKVYGASLVVAILLLTILAPTGYFGPLSSRVRGLFVKHTRTGNPLVDSVAEHQPASKGAYYSYLHYTCYVAPVGFILTLPHALKDRRSSFILLYGLVTYFFSNKMMRLILLTGPVASALAGIAVGKAFHFAFNELVSFSIHPPKNSSEDIVAEKDTAVVKNGSSSKATKKGGNSTSRTSSKNCSSSEKKKEEASSSPPELLARILGTKNDDSSVFIVKKLFALVLVAMLYKFTPMFMGYCVYMSRGLSNPSIIYKARTRGGDEVLIDDYREAYTWLKHNTPEDSRILSWWDYGYQISAIANRTTIADGNTWNHEHIALLGMILTTSEKQGHRIARHLADYVLVWAGGGGDDLAKSPHLARIANSVYRDLCPDDPTCRTFGFLDRKSTPSKQMSKSFLYKLHSHKLAPGVEADPNRFKEVYKSKYGKVRIFKILGVSKESKDWVADPKNRICDVEGGWFCRGQYPPALEPVLKNKKDFAQLEDFNNRKDDKEYQEKYFENMANPKKAKLKALAKEGSGKDGEASARKVAKRPKDMNAEELAKFKEKVRDRKRTWVNTEESTQMWQMIHENRLDELASWIEYDPSIVFIRSEDGRGPMWWAYEYKNEAAVLLLKRAGLKTTDKDKSGKTPIDLYSSNREF